jgi:acetyltransferase-like isoleucine patch superfamily enzyme
MWDSKSESLEIGSYVSIAAGVQFVIGGNHALNTLTTYPLKVLRWQEQSESLSKGPVAVKDDVWIGTNSIILSGVTLEQGSVVAAGSVVTKSVPPYAIVGGNPAKIIRYRFPLEVIERLLRLNFKKIMQLPRESLEPFAYSELTEQNLSQLEKKLSQ